jgi:hypothetical protein
MTTDTISLSPAQQIEVRSACEQVALDYAYYADNGRREDLASLFAEDGEFHLFGNIHVGPAAVLESLNANPVGSVASIHSLSNHRVEAISHTEARGTAYVTVFVFDKTADPPAVISPVVVGIYHDVYRRTEAGWRFARRAFEPLITPTGA